MEQCLFCEKILNGKDILFENDFSVALFDEFPVTTGHLLIISKRHAATFFELTGKEQFAMIELLNKCKGFLEKKFKPDGFNVGLNCGEAAGQSIMHVHMHLIPRYFGDVENPRGGVRGVIPNKKNY